MTRDDIIRLAKEAGWSEHTVVYGHNDRFERFASLVAAQEREACAKLVEPDEEHRRDARLGYIGGEEGVELLDIVAAKIRRRGEVKP